MSRLADRLDYWAARCKHKAALNPQGEQATLWEASAKLRELDGQLAQSEARVRELENKQFTGDK